MPPAKKQKTMRKSDVSAQDSHSDSSDSAFECVHQHKAGKQGKKAKSKDDESQNASTPEDAKLPAPHEYICINRPYFDVQGENWVKWKTDPDAYVSPDDVFKKLYKPIIEQEIKDDIYRSSPEKHPNHKWVIMWAAWLKVDIFGRKARYCDADYLGLNLESDWKAYGMSEVAQNMLLEFDKAYRSKGPKRLDEMWAVISALGFWINLDDHLEYVISGDDGDGICDLIGMIGCAFLTALAAVEREGELKPDSRFLDLGLVMSYYMEFSYDLPPYGIEGDCVAWRRDAVAFFKKSNVDYSKCLSTTKQRVEMLEKVDEYNEDRAEARSSKEAPEGKDAEKENADPEASNEESQSPTSANGKRKRGSDGAKSGGSKGKKKDEDPFSWTTRFRQYKKQQGPAMGGQQYDITKMTRAERASAAYDGKDPFADVPAKELKENLVDFLP